MLFTDSIVELSAAAVYEVALAVQKLPRNWTGQERKKRRTDTYSW